MSESITDVDINVKWHQPFVETRQDPSWFVRAETQHSLVATISSNNRIIMVYCDGFLDITAQFPGQVECALTSPADLLVWGLNNDAQLLEECGKGNIEWVNNAWFDLYEIIDGSEEHLDAVYFDILEAIAAAVEIMTGGTGKPLG